MRLFDRKLFVKHVGHGHTGRNAWSSLLLVGKQAADSKLQMPHMGGRSDNGYGGGWVNKWMDECCLPGCVEWMTGNGELVGLVNGWNPIDERIQYMDWMYRWLTGWSRHIRG